MRGSSSTRSVAIASGKAKPTGRKKIKSSIEENTPDRSAAATVKIVKRCEWKGQQLTPVVLHRKSTVLEELSKSATRFFAILYRTAHDVRISVPFANGSQSSLTDHLLYQNKKVKEKWSKFSFRRQMSISFKFGCVIQKFS